jgi:hypothetical protein
LRGTVSVPSTSNRASTRFPVAILVHGQNQQQERRCDGHYYNYAI